MAVTRTNIIAQPVDVYIRQATGTLTSVAAATCATQGVSAYAVGEGKVKFSQDVYEEALADGTPAQIGVMAKLEIELLETSATIISALETSLATTTGLFDVFLLQAGTVAGSNKTGWVFGGYGMTMQYEGVFTRKNANSLKLVFKKAFGTASGAFTYSTTLTLT